MHAPSSTPASSSKAEAAGEESPVVARPRSAAAPFDGQSHTTERWNFWVMTWYQVILRVGWIFKTESIIMPAVLDSLGCGPAVRAWLPLFNRLGQSVPPIMAAHRVRGAAKKKRLLALFSFLMAAFFLALSACWWWTGGSGPWLPYAFLAIYALFFVCTGIHQLCFGALQGKLVPVRRRGRLLLAANILGASSACLMAAWLLPYWLTPEGGLFEVIFGFVGACFLIAAAGALLLREHPDNYGLPPTTLATIVSGARSVWRTDSNVRRLAVVGAMFGVSVVLFPHYQAIARDRLGLTFENMMIWVVVQNAGTALFSFIVGPMADRKGNRLVLLFVMSIVCLSPLMAIGFSYLGPEWGGRLFPLVFLFVGLTPNVFRTFNNYTLEISAPADHPRFLSTISLFIAAPAFLSPLFGLLVKWIDFEPVFLGAAVVLLLGWLLAFGLKEPRDLPPPSTRTP